MFAGRSIYHVHQGVGKIYSKEKLQGYYNDFTEKVLRGDRYLEDGLPFLEDLDGSHIKFPISIFQYGLGAYDLWLMTGCNIFYKKFLLCSQWTIENQEASGAWNTFYYIYPDHPYSAMSQGEGSSLALRMYKETKDAQWLCCAERAIDFMLTPVSEGGTSQIDNQGNLILLEYTNQEAVLNGWIFAFFGLFDFLKFNEQRKYYLAYNNTLNAIILSIHKFDCGYWSMYDLNGRIASPFYHSLHIALMSVMNNITGEEIFTDYAKRWVGQQRNPVKKCRALLKKSLQKIIE